MNQLEEEFHESVDETVEMSEFAIEGAVDALRGTIHNLQLALKQERNAIYEYEALLRWMAEQAGREFYEYYVEGLEATGVREEAEEDKEDEGKRCQRIIRAMGIVDWVSVDDLEGDGWVIRTGDRSLGEYIPVYGMTIEEALANFAETWETASGLDFWALYNEAVELVDNPTEYARQRGYGDGC